MNEVFRPYLRKFVLVFFDDILIYSDTEEEHALHLSLVLAKLDEYTLYTNTNKCQFVIVKSLGAHHISWGSVNGPEEGEGNVSFENPPPPPPIIWRNFMGFWVSRGIIIVIYRVMRNCSTTHFAASQAFEALKQAMVTAPVLALPNFHFEFVIEADASGIGLGIVLFQSELTYYSKMLGP